MQDVMRRQSVDLSAYPDLVMILLGFQVRGWRGVRSMARIGPGLASVGQTPPDGLLAHETFSMSFTHRGIRQYWRDMASLEAFTRSEPHAEWWRNLKRYADGASFWHETYHMRGGIEALYLGMDEPVGLQRFAPELRPTGPFMSARARQEATRSRAA
jgi:hypothetical protein